MSRVAVLAMILAAVGCGDGGGDSAEGEAGGEAGGSAGTGEETSLTVGFGRVVPQLDRHMQDGGFDTLYNVTDPLWQIDENGELQPGLVESWEQSDESRTRVQLREDVVFSDGEVFNAEVFKMNVDRVMEVGSFTGIVDSALEGVEVVDEYTADILHGPQVGLLHVMAGYVEIYSPAVIEEDPDSLATHPVGSGPYEVVEYESGRALTLRARDDYWGADVEGFGAPSIDNVTIQYGLEPGVRLAGLQSGDLDVVQDMPPSNAQQLEDDMRVVLQSPELYFLRFGMKDPVTSDPRVREAINLAIDREALNASFLNEGTPATQIFAKHVQGWADRGPVPEANVERARELIQEAGVEGETLEFVYSTEYKVGIGPMSEAMAAMIEDIGLKVSLTDLDGTRFREILRQVDDPPALLTLSFGFDTLQGAKDVTSRVTCEGSMSTYCNEEVDRLFAEAIQTPDDAEREAMLQQAMDIIEEDNGLIPLMSPPLFWGKQPNLQITTSALPTMDIKSWSWQ